MDAGLDWVKVCARLSILLYRFVTCLAQFGLSESMSTGRDVRGWVCVVLRSVSGSRVALDLVGAGVTRLGGGGARCEELACLAPDLVGSLMVGSHRLGGHLAEAVVVCGCSLGPV